MEISDDPNDTAFSILFRDLYTKRKFDQEINEEFLKTLLNEFLHSRFL
jgi:hypothetical protein